MKTKRKIFQLSNALLFTFLLGLMACNGQSKQEQGTETPEVSSYVKMNPNAFKNSLEQETSDYYLIDVRTAGEFNAGAIEGAVNYDLLNGDFEKAMKELDSEKPVYVYCAKGGRSSKAAGMMEKAGFKDIKELKGGYTAWE